MATRNKKTQNRLNVDTSYRYIGTAEGSGRRGAKDGLGGGGGDDNHGLGLGKHKIS